MEMIYRAGWNLLPKTGTVMYYLKMIHARRFLKESIDGIAMPFKHGFTTIIPTTITLYNAFSRLYLLLCYLSQTFQ